jgi:transketolase
MSVEAGITLGWNRYSHYQIGIFSFGKSGNISDIGKDFGFTTENVAKKSFLLMKYFNDKKIPNLNNIII